MIEMEVNTCRLCGMKTESEYSKYIFDEITNFAQIINETLPIKVSQDDHSKYICLDCYNKIISHYDFIQSVLAYTKESATNIASFFEVNRNEKLENVIISKLNNDMIYTCPNCNKDVILLIKNNFGDNDCTFQISLVAVDQMKESMGENSQISEDIMELVNIDQSKTINELHELSSNCDIVDRNMTNNNKGDINGIYISLQEDTNHMNSYITLENINVSYELNKGVKRKFQESKTSINSIKVQKLDERLDVTEQDANESNNDYDTSSVTDLITFQSINNSIEEPPSESVEVQEETNMEYMAEMEHSDKNLIKSQILEIKSDAKKQKENESDSDYDRSSIAGLITYQPEDNDDDGMEYVSGDTEIEDGNTIDDMRKIKECVNKDDTNDSDIPKSNEKQVCKLCGACYISQVKYQFHMERHKLNKIDKYACLICDKETKNENLLWDHYLYIHKNTTRYICLDCNRAFTRKPYLNMHQKRQRHTGYKKTVKVDTNEDNNQTQNDIKKFKRKCTVCRKLIRDVDPNAINDLRMCASCEESDGFLIVNGEVKIISQRQYHCLKCRKHFMRRERLEFHEMRHNENMDEFICSTCGKEFSGENSLYEHYLFVHKGARPHICDVCGKSFQLKARLKEHLRKHTGELPYQCEICGQRCMTTHALKFHKRSHFSTRHSCEICDKSFIKKQNLNEHLEKHWKKDKNISLSQIFTCPICNCELPTFRMLKHHMLGIHQLERHDPLITKQKPLYECNECQEKFKHQMSLKAHKKVHEGKGIMPPRTFQCDVCKAEYKAKQMLINHIKSKHSNEKQYECAQCNERFADVKTLYRHILLHTSRKPFTCEYCNMSFKRKEIRDVHRRKHTNDRPYQCTDCDKSFGSYSSRSNHRKKAHGDNEIECPECKAKCGDIQEIRIHLNKHLGEKLSKLESE